MKKRDNRFSQIEVLIMVENLLWERMRVNNMSKKKLYVQREGFTWNNEFFVIDESGMANYSVDGNFFTLATQKLHIKDMTGKEVAWIQHMVLSFVPRFLVFKGENQIAEIVLNFKLPESIAEIVLNFKLPESFDVKGPNWKVEGNINDHLFCVFHESSIIINIDRIRITSGDSYILEFDESTVEVLVIAVALVIDAVAELDQRLKNID